MGKIKEKIINPIFGLEANGPFVQVADLNELAKICEPAQEHLENIAGHLKLNRILTSLLLHNSEFLSLMAVRNFALGGIDNLMWGVGLIFASGVLKTLGFHIINTQKRQIESAMEKAFSYLDSLEEMQMAENSHLLPIWQKEIMSMVSAEYQLTKKPPEQKIWLTLQLANLFSLFPEIYIAIITQFILSLGQIEINTKKFRGLETRYVQKKIKGKKSIKIHKKTTRKEDEEERKAIKHVVRQTSIINLLTNLTPLIPLASVVFSKKITTGALLATSTIGLIPALNTLASQVSGILGSTIGAYQNITNALIGRGRFKSIIEEILSVKILTKNQVDWKYFIEKRKKDEKIKEVFNKKNINLPEESRSLLFANIHMPNPKTKAPLIENLSGFIKLGEGITVVTGNSGSGKSILAQTILQKYKKATGRTGFAENGKIIVDIREYYPRIQDRDKSMICINSTSVKNSAYFADLALPYNMKISILSREGYDIEDEEIRKFIRLSWKEKREKSRNNKKLERVFETLQREILVGLEETGLFANSSYNLNYYLLQVVEGYSDGEKQRLSLALSHFNPHAKFIIFDEPFRALDGNESKKAVAKYLKKLVSKKIDVVIITHESDQNINLLLQNSVGCHVHLKDGVLAPVKGYEHMAMLLSNKKICVHEIPDKTKGLNEIKTDIIKIQNYNQNSLTYFELSEKIVKQLIETNGGSDNKLTFDDFDKYVWEKIALLLVEKINYVIVKKIHKGVHTSDDNEKLYKLLELFDKIFYSLFEESAERTVLVRDNQTQQIVSFFLLIYEQINQNLKITSRGEKFVLTQTNGKKHYYDILDSSKKFEHHLNQIKESEEKVVFNKIEFLNLLSNNRYKEALDLLLSFQEVVGERSIDPDILTIEEWEKFTNEADNFLISLEKMREVGPIIKHLKKMTKVAIGLDKRADFLIIMMDNDPYIKHPLTTNLRSSIEYTLNEFHETRISKSLSNKEKNDLLWIKKKLGILKKA